MSSNVDRTSMLRARWAAIGAAVAVTFGAGGWFAASAASSPASEFVAIDPVRIVDTRDEVFVQRISRLVSQSPQDMQVTGSFFDGISSQPVVVPDGATAVVMNVTAIEPELRGFISIRPADLGGQPSTSSLNVEEGAVVANQVTVRLPTDGDRAGYVEISFDSYGQFIDTGTDVIIVPGTDVVVDVVGYYTASGGG